MNNCRVFRARAALKEFAWGMRDPNCWVSMLCANMGSEGPYAEAWFGTHPSGSASVEASHGHFVSLRDFCAAHADQLFDTALPLRSLPYQGKVLCVGEPLSIQLHPRKDEAIRLRSQKPREYPDEEPKNEAGIALTEVQLLYGYRSVPDILNAIAQNPEFRELLGKVAHQPRQEAIANPTAFLRAVTEAVLAADAETVERCSAQLYERLADFVTDGLDEVDTWVLKMKEFYPRGDAGIYFFYLLNLVTLQPGQSLAIPVGRLHAYLKGQLIEVMQSGDNVIRVAMTPKFKDPTEVLTCGEFEPIDPTALIGTGSYSADSRRSYVFGDFGFKVEVYEDPGEFDIQPSDTPQFFVSFDGVGSLASPNKDSIALTRCDAAVYPAAKQLGSLKLTSGRIVCFRMR